MAKQLMSLCEIPKVATRDGYTGANAHLILPFYTEGDGIWFASGQIYDFPAATVAQYRKPTLVGERKPDTFRKDCCSCLAG